MGTEYDAARKLYQPKITEEHVLREIVQRLAFNKIKTWRIVERIPWGKTTSTPGLPDLYCRRGNFHFWIEVKKPGGKLRPAQETFIREAEADMTCAFKAERWEDVVEGLAKWGFSVT